ncbi:MAG: acyl-CoA dehydrogenase family protein, partial [Candidatus Cybelea sp.]
MTPPDAVDFVDVAALLSNEERLVRETVRSYVRDRILPNVADWFEEGRLPRELGTELGRLGLLGMHLD